MSLSNGWTGAQYSLYRLILGGYLVLHFAQLVPWGAELFSSAGMLGDAAASPLYPLFPNLLFLLDAPALVTALLLLGVVLSLAFALGVADRVAALCLWYLWACLFTRNPLISNPSLPFIGWLLLAHALLPRQPWGSWHARDSADAGSAWRMPPELFAAAWIVMSLGYTYSGWAKLGSPSWIDGSALARVLANPLARPGIVPDLLLALPGSLLSLLTWGALGLELLFAPLALLRRLRPWLWLALLVMHGGLMLLIDFADLSFGMIVLHLFTFDPGWIAPREPGRQATMFYDGACGLCHRTVRFLLSEDRDGRAFRFAALDSDSFRQALPEAERAALPDSIVVLTPEGELLLRSDAILAAGQRLGGVWRVGALIVGLIPRGLRDAAYDRIAALRHRLFARPAEACPIVPADLRARFRS